MITTWGLTISLLKRLGKSLFKYRHFGAKYHLASLFVQLFRFCFQPFLQPSLDSFLFFSLFQISQRLPEMLVLLWFELLQNRVVECLRRLYFFQLTLVQYLIYLLFGHALKLLKLNLFTNLPLLIHDRLQFHASHPVLFLELLQVKLFSGWVSCFAQKSVQGERLLALVVLLIQHLGGLGLDCLRDHSFIVF